MYILFYLSQTVNQKDIWNITYGSFLLKFHLQHDLIQRKMGITRIAYLIVIIWPCPGFPRFLVFTTNFEKWLFETWVFSVLPILAPYFYSCILPNVDMSVEPWWTEDCRTEPVHSTVPYVNLDCSPFLSVKFGENREDTTHSCTLGCHVRECWENRSALIILNKGKD